MEKHQCIIIEMQNGAYLSYLKLCESLKEAPRAEIYDQINDCKDSKKLYQITVFIENERKAFENRTPPKHANFFTKLFKL
ncbi:hypothetical protein [Chryseobacterium turcicum]|uniref:Uncharacterized protein n=1 Tax=Chryseobacterium turcicum TaxID=2898076 RepID=A0A9Q3V1K7_9FLAO|nr:hypothetical protein [Chryseobacterium turcicum]MCD1115596.1 hypothetical protein [Chryseobacterium turcicum]